MKIYIIAAVAAALGTGAMAQQEQRGSHNPIVKDSQVHSVPAPARGSSSFTEQQARGRIAKAGFTKIGDLRKTEAGSWQGQATRRGKAMVVTLDYKGNVTAR
ncbi:hypothetical protein ACSBM8_18620 [Sphingomonas sp. ASY06-1R]|uniref:hypothetical protein n=1 Tax=Sphingomonas sp. ASY06-1R TaxID=3445771 RepID=UPI003FA2216E